MKHSWQRIALIALLALMASATGVADTYHSATFSGQLGSSPNIKSPFSSVLTGGGAVSGSFVYDDQQVPGGGTGFVNVFFSGYPDINTIPSPAVFTLDLGGGLVFNYALALDGNAAIQYNNGNFNGFFYVSDFDFQGNPYELQVQGGVFNIVAIENGYPTFSNLVSGTLNIGDSNLGNVAVYTPSSSVPEPSSMILLGSGVAGLAGVMRKAVRK